VDHCLGGTWARFFKADDRVRVIKILQLVSDLDSFLALSKKATRITSPNAASEGWSGKIIIWLPFPVMHS
jgi:hypothetical protein